MSYTYSGNPNSSPIDEVHYRLGDVNPANPIATDEECAFALRENRGNTYLAAADIAETKAMEFVYTSRGRQAGGRTGRDTLGDHFMIMARQLRLNASLKTATVYAGGLSEAEHQSAMRETDLRQPFATKHKHELRHSSIERDDAWG